MESQLTEFGQFVAHWMSTYSSLTIVGGAMFIIGLFAWLVSRWPEWLLVWTLSFGYAAIPFLGR